MSAGQLPATLTRSELAELCQDKQSPFDWRFTTRGLAEADEIYVVRDGAVIAHYAWSDGQPGYWSRE